jgi:L-malate glycosyltransferase
MLCRTPSGHGCWYKEGSLGCSTAGLEYFSVRSTLICHSGSGNFVAAQRMYLRKTAAGIIMERRGERRGYAPAMAAAWNEGPCRETDGESVKKICIATPEYPPEQWGGLARTVQRAACHARDMGLQVHVAHLAVNPQPIVLLDENRTVATQEGVIVHKIAVAKEKLTSFNRELWECPHTLTLQMMYQSLEMLHRGEQFDLFHSFFLYPVGYVTGLLARRMHIPSVLTVVGNDVKKYLFSPEKVGVCRSGLENADRIVALSQELKDMADALTPVAEKTRIIYNSVDAPDVQWVGRDKGHEPFRIGCGGIFKYEKGLPYLFKAVAQLRATRPLILELRGRLRPSEQETYEEMVERTGTRDRVRLLDPLPHDAMPDWLRTLDVFVLPSVSEGCPNVLMEALASGVPSIATTTGANSELIHDHVSGLLVPWGDSSALACALTKIMENPDLAKTLGVAGRTRMQGFSVERERQAWESVFRELIDL